MKGVSLLVALMAAAAIQSAIAAGDVVLDETLSLRGREQWTRPLQPSKRDLILIVVRERGADVELSVTPGPGISYNVDSPIERGGLMAVVLPPSDAKAPATIRISAKEPLRYQGAVQISARRLKTTDHQTVRAWLHFMTAGQNYAELKALRGGTPAAAHVARLGASAINEYSMSADAANTARQAPLFAWATFHHARMTYDEQSDYDKTVALSDAAESAMRTARDEFGAMRATSLSAAALRDGASALKKSASKTILPTEVSARFARSIERFRSVERFHTQRREKFEAAQAINNIGLAHYLQGDHAQALAEYERAVPMFHEISDGPNEARTIQNAALTRFELGDRGCAAGYDEALRILDRADDLQLYGDILNNAALCHRMLSNFDRALSYYEEAFRIQSSLQNELQIARTLHGMGATYFGLGDLTTALDMYQQALTRRPAAKDARGRASTLNALGNIACERRHYPEAIDYYEQALVLAVAPLTRARMQLRLARCLTLAGRAWDASLHLQEIERSGLHKEAVTEALSHVERARIQIATASWQNARREISAALPLLSQHELLEEQAEALMLAASIAIAQGNQAEALRYVDRGIRLGEHIRTRSNNPELRATLFAPWRKFYDLKIGLLTGPSTPARLPPDIARQALQVSEAARARALEELLIEAKNVASSSSTQTESERLLTELSEKRVQLASWQERFGTDDPRAQRLLRDVAALRTRLDAMGASPIYASIAPTAATFGAPAIPEDTAILVYWLGEQHALSWVITSDGLDAFKLGTPRKIHATATKLHQALASSSVPNAQVNAALRSASADLLPASHRLQLKKRWVVLADGPLHHVPFGALSLVDANAPAVADHEISVAPALRLLGPRVTTGRSITRALLVADPVFNRDDERLLASTRPTAELRASTRMTYARLRGTATEVERISAHFPDVSITRLVGWQANREQVLTALRSPFDLIHVATHSRVDADVPQLSAIVLSGYDEQGRERSPWLHASELRSSQLKDALFVLSACESGLGKSVGGEGLVGLSYSLLSAGARGVLASNWRVADAATVDYMDAFYRSLRDDPNLATAAAHASRALMHSKRWQEPRYWASFVAYQNEI